MSPERRAQTEELREIYHRRFEATRAYRNEVWKVLTSAFFGRYFHPTDSVLDLGCGYGEFINNIQCREKFAMDLNADAAGHLNVDVKFLFQDCSTEWQLGDATLDLVFTSNFFEHLPDKSALSRTLEQAARCLRPGGKLIAMGPNIKYLPGAYWDFWDHHVALTELSLRESLELRGFIIEKVVDRFLPYTLLDAPRYPLLLLKAYLKMPIAWRFAGKQFLLIATKRS